MVTAKTLSRSYFPKSVNETITRALHRSCSLFDERI
jgi:hypothetical protein